MFFVWSSFWHPLALSPYARYTPYFFDKKMLDNILQESVDQHFHALIETRNSQRRRDVIDDSLSAEAVEEMNESMWDPPEVQIYLSSADHFLVGYKILRSHYIIKIILK